MRKRKYEVELIIKIVKENIEKGVNSRQLSAQYNIDHGTIEGWIIQYKQNGVSAFFRKIKTEYTAMPLSMQPAIAAAAIMPDSRGSSE